MSRFAGRTALVSGGLGGIGLAIAELFASEGARVALGDLADPEQAAAAVDGLRRYGPARYDRVDMTDSAQVQDWVRRVEGELGTPTLVLAAAGTSTNGSLLSTDSSYWQQDLNANLTSSFVLATTAARHLVAAGLPGRIVFTGSWAGHAPHPAIPAYSVAKAGLRMLTKTLALEFAQHDIQVNEIAIGIVDGGMTGRRMDAEPVMRERALGAVPLHRLLSLEDVAYQAAYLCDPANRHMTGTLVLIDGGLSLLQARPVL